MSLLSSESVSVTPAARQPRARAERARERPAAFGPDIDLTTLGRPGERERVQSLRSLEHQVREAALLAGIDSEEVARAASYFQVDYSAIYQRLQQAYQGQIELMTSIVALQRYDWLRDYWWQAVAVDTDKYTAATALEQTGGFFLRVFAGQHVAQPIQACLFVQESNISQNVHNLILMEEGAEAQLITGCTLHPRVETGLHIGVTEVFLDRGVTLTNTMIHNWAEGFHVRPRTGVIAGERATFRNNYILLQPVRSVQSEPRVILQGDGARTQLNSIVVGRKDSSIDLGAHIELRGRGTQAEVLARAAAQDQSELALRTLVIGADNESRAHVDCRGMLLSEQAQIHAVPALTAARAPGCQLSHEAAVGPIAEDVVEYLMTRGLPRDEATSTLVLGFLKLELPGLPAIVMQQINRVLAATAGKSL